MKLYHRATQLVEKDRVAQFSVRHFLLSLMNNRRIEAKFLSTAQKMVQRIVVVG
jgi:hypothetical protein